MDIIEDFTVGMEVLVTIDLKPFTRCEQETLYSEDDRLAYL